MFGDEGWLGMFNRPIQASRQVCATCCSVQTKWKQSCSVSDHSVCAFFFLAACVSQILGIIVFNSWLLCADMKLKYGIQLWTDVIRWCVDVAGSVCVCVCTVTKVVIFCPCSYWPPVICWSKLLTETDLLVRRCWTNKQQPENISQGKNEGSEDLILILFLSQHNEPSKIPLVINF